MPNGGSDCCGNCTHNRAVQVMAHPHPEEWERFWQLSFCTLRDVKITNPFWTYCHNFDDARDPDDRNSTETPVGWIYTSGLYEGYVRIPWDDRNEPRVSVPTRCIICGWKTEEGIVVVDQDGHTLGFCTNRHYIQWWKTRHDDDSLDPDDYESPEERHKNRDM